MNCPAYLSSVTKSKLRDDLGAIREVSRFQPQNGTMYAKRSEFQPLRRYFNLLSNRLTPESSRKRPGVLSEPPNLWTTEVSHFFAILFDAPTSAATKMFPVCQGCGATDEAQGRFLKPALGGCTDCLNFQELGHSFRLLPVIIEVVTIGYLVCISLVDAWGQWWR